MSEAELEERESALATYWPIVLSDWRRAGAMVTLTLRSGATIGPGKVTHVGSQSPDFGVVGLHDDGMDYSGYSSGWRQARPERKWSIDINEVVAVEAEAKK